MRRLSRKEVLEGIGVFSIVASLIFVGLQVNQSQRVGEGAEFTAYLEMAGAKRSIFIDNADVWHKACSGARLTPGEKIKAAQLYKHYVEFVFVTAAASRVGIAQDWPEFLINRFAANLHRYPGFAKLATEHGLWVTEGERGLDDQITRQTYESIQARLAELRVIEPEPDYDVMWCGI